MKTLKEYAIDHGIKYRAAWNRYKAGKIPSAFQDEFGKILYPWLLLLWLVYMDYAEAEEKPNN